MKYITRFAPSPTGKLHIGSARTALFDYLAAKATNGKFLFRIEDTDRARFVEGSIENFHQGLNWLGIKHDGEVIYQSDRLPIYQKVCDQLIEKGSAYKCFCTPERLSELKKEADAKGIPFVYDRHCLELSKEDINKLEQDNSSFVIRFKIPESPAEISWNDKIRGTVTIPTNVLEDFIILKSDKWPTYNLAHIVDDHEQGITLVVRGQEFVPSTPKYILVHEALGWKHPEYAHVPEIIGTDHKKLSKRNGDVSLDEYMKKGYLPEAVVNFLALLGWNPGTTEEIFSLAELENKFSIDRVGKSQSLFDVDRLDWINGVWIRSLKVNELVSRLLAFDESLQNKDQALLTKIATVEQTRIKTLGEFSEIASSYWALPKYDKDMLVFKKSTSEATKIGLDAFVAALSSLDDAESTQMTVEGYNALLASVVADNNLNNADVYWPVRVALSGLERSASPAEFLWVLGKAESLRRLTT